MELRAGHLVTFLVTFQGFTGQICGPYSVDVSQGNRTSRGIHPVPAESRRRGGQAWGRKRGGGGWRERAGEGCAGLLRREGAWTHSRTNLVKSALLFHKRQRCHAHPIHEVNFTFPTPSPPGAPSRTLFAHPHFSSSFPLKLHPCFADCLLPPSMSRVANNLKNTHESYPIHTPPHPRHC